jgi:predicted NodU family carbamoyl transferase
MVIYLNPNFSYAFSNKGSSLDGLNRYQEAIECFERTRMDMLILNNFVVLKTK